MSDYPDWTDLVQIIGADIMVPIDLQAAYIMMPVDIQAQYLTLEIDIVAQSVGNIAIDLAAQSVGDITVDIAAQTLGNLNVNIAATAVTLDINIAATDVTLDIDITAQSVGVYLQPEWSALTGIDKNLAGSATAQSGAFTIIIEYVVPAGKTFYLCQWGVYMIEDAGVMVALGYVHGSTYTYLARGGGYAGATQSFTKPLVVTAGDTIRLVAFQVTRAAR